MCRSSAGRNGDLARLGSIRLHLAVLPIICRIPDIASRRRFGTFIQFQRSRVDRFRHS